MGRELTPSFWTMSTSPWLYNFVDTTRPDLPHLVLGCGNLDTLEQRVERSRNGSFQLLTVRVGSVDFHFALCSGFEIGEFSRSEGSSAIYLAKLDLGDRGILIQRVPPDTLTSPHAHETKVETFHQILGRPILRLGTPSHRDGEREIRLRESYSVPKGVWHQLKTVGHHTLTLLEVVGPKALGMGDYVRE